MKKTSVLAVLLVAGIALGGVSYAWMGPMNFGDMTEEEISEFQEVREQIQTAIENGDYETWLALMQERFAEMTSEENYHEKIPRILLYTEEHNT